MSSRPIAHWLERHQRGLVVTYLAALGLACAIVIVPPLRGAVTERASRLFDIREAALIDRIAEAEQLVVAGDLEEAVERLYRLDREFPARTNLHSLDRERERILHALGTAELALGRKNRALNAFRAAVAFDPLNIGNHHALGQAALALDEVEEAEEHFRHGFRLFPSHAGSFRALVGLRFEDADYAGVVELFETYVSATRIHMFEIAASDDVVIARVPVDGEAHVLRVPLSGLDLASPLEVRSGWPTLRIEAVAWLGAVIAGIEGRVGGDADFSPGGNVVRLPTHAEVALVTARAGIPIDDVTLGMVETAYRNLLRTEEGSRLSGRLVTVTTSEWDAAELEPR